MRRPSLYSSSPSRKAAPAGQAGAVPQPPEAQPPARTSRWSASSPRLLWSAIALLMVLLIAAVALGLRPGERRLTQKDIDAAVLKTLETTTLPSAAARAAENVRPSVVRVVSYVKKSRLKEEAERMAKVPKGSEPAKPKTPNLAMQDKPEEEEIEHGVGTGVVIVDKGVILTNLHVVSGADRIKVVFADGLEATANITGVQAENDLAVLQASKIPDDLIAATMRSTGDLQPGDQVVAVGFPFGIGPSVSAGVISGLKRSFRSPEGKQEMANLIQFDAAANPGNSGGPLVTMDGEVVGIVTAILNPTSARTFVGIGFAVPIENAAQAAGLPPF
ncbi:MAG: trypsin-like peptidase domain-containing protein [Burkholderiaceae bacterium]